MTSGIVRKKRLPDGTYGELESVFGGETTKQKIERLEAENLNNMLAMTDMFESNIQLIQDNAQLMLAITDLFELVIGGEE